ncbi:hypothetical protein O3M35_008309 [Rhynocoris fuscipes]|uniref:Uncharacterized protein n=1 Tax=Rhynocoris fuscipes TaxID=488301 RepID=A0AAW1D6H3_9HEMI
MYSIAKIHVLSIVLLSTIVSNTEGIYCPPYCRCSVTNSLRHVKCKGQNLISVDLDVPRSVQWFEVSYNSISELGDYIFMNLGLENIVILDLNHNAINSISLNAFQGLDFVKFIDLSGNHLYRLDPRTFENILSLEHLKLSSNPLRYIPENQPFLISTSLRNLEISHCRISYFPSHTFDSLPNLNTLNISNNDILILHEDVLNTLENLKDLDITNTAIKCDSGWKFLTDWASLKSVNIFGSPCSLKPNDNGVMKKFEKMVLSPELVIPHDEDYDNIGEYIYDSSEKCSCLEEITDDEMKSETSTVSSKTVRKVSQNDYRGMLWLAFLNGLVTGAAISSSAILFWIYCCKYRMRRNDMRTVTTIHYDRAATETPPPSYNDLF